MNTLAGTACLLAAGAFTAYAFADLENQWLGGVGVCMIAFGFIATAIGVRSDL